MTPVFCGHASTKKSRRGKRAFVHSLRIFHWRIARDSDYETSMRLHVATAVLAVLVLGGCASLPTRNFQADYERAPHRSTVRVEGYAPFGVAELRDQQRLRVELNAFAQAFGGLADPLVLVGISSGIPPASAHEAAARAYLAQTGRPSCSVHDGAVSPNGRQYEFRYTCA
jgi:hypothetical protein